MTCDEVRLHLVDHQRGRLAPERHGQMLAHLEQCAACAHEEAAEQALTELLERRLPQHVGSFALKRRLAAAWPPPPPALPARWSRWRRTLVPAAAVALALMAVAPVYYFISYGRGAAGPGAMVAEAVSDHLRILVSPNPLEIRSGGIHQVKPWFEGRLDFAPALRFPGDQDFPLQGGAVGYFLDRKAAVLVFNRRLHTITLFVFRADGFPWPARGLVPMGNARAYAAAERGFNVILWRDGELGYALVSDVDRQELATLGTRLVGGS